MKFNACVKNIKSMQSNGQIFKIYNYVNFFYKVIILSYNQVNLQSNFVHNGNNNDKEDEEKLQPKLQMYY